MSTQGPTCIYCTDGRFAASGSGDGFTRYVLWARLGAAGMPGVFCAPQGTGSGAPGEETGA